MSEKYDEKLKENSDMDSNITVTRIHLKTDAENRTDLIDFCLNDDKANQFIAIGWIGAYEVNPNIKSYEDYYYAVKEKYKKNIVIVIMFSDTQKKEIFFGRETLTECTGYAESSERHNRYTNLIWI